MAKKECCQNPANLKLEATDKPDLVIDRCQVCNARHFRLFVEPGVIGLQGTPMGAEGTKEAPPGSPWNARRTTT